MKVDVAIAGGGPAASVAAMLLTRAGASCVILERGDDRGDKAGECLPPAARPLLEELELWDALERDGHRPCHGNRSVWGTDVVDEMPFVFTPYGHGWHLDRRRFERMLVERSGAVRRTNTRVAGVREHTLLCDDGSEVEAEWILDATGRAAAVARRFGATRIIDDSLVASVAFLENGGRGMDDTFTLVEAVENGWWYSAPVPDGRLVVMFVSDRARGELQIGAHTSERIRANGFTISAPATVVDAGSARLDRVAGDRWLAIGDAATALDPLSSHGLGNAIASARNAARAVISGRTDLYERAVDETWSGYVALRQDTYALEQRWASSAFWAARHTGSRLRGKKEVTHA